jgi:hypothetical protein
VQLLARRAGRGVDDERGAVAVALGVLTATQALHVAPAASVVRGARDAVGVERGAGGGGVRGAQRTKIPQRIDRLKKIQMLGSGKLHTPICRHIWQILDSLYR